ncbi:AAA domain-containing protein [Micromonospora pattaloongensis]|uniref:AAA domain-containing protein n=1 Tax=Micromonospora pattaloongensis TaxID=405436 RepID=A0A1H3R2S2_9ACTN|nr:ATP-binding protein [Micromonospora pattaloongensis]SDZ19605.1 AAA domain-containing protein [Micromonospora pattaloongensis]
MTSRKDLPERVRALLSAPANVAVHGSPGSGKSWISDRVIASLDGGGARLVRVDLSTVMSGLELFSEIATSTSQSLRREAGTSLPPNTHAAWKAARLQIEQAGCHVILVLDQFDRALHFDDGQEFLLLFRELVHRPETLPCTALILSRRSLQSIEAKVSGISTLASVCYTEFLGSVSIDDVSSFVPGVNSISATDAIECLKWSGGHPALVKYWLTVRPDRNPARAADLERSKLFLRVIDYLNEIDLVDAAAQFVLGPIIEDMLLEKQELELLGILSLRGDSSADEAALSDQDIFRDALRNRTWSLDPWGILGRAEVRLRAAVEARMMDVYGSDWPALVAKKSPAITRARNEALQKMERDQKMFARQAPWLSYTYPGDLWTIIQAEWQHFQKVFEKNDKVYWRSVLTGLAQYRAPLAHGRPEVLGEAQRAQCRIFANEVIESINRFEASTRTLPRRTVET